MDNINSFFYKRKQKLFLVDIIGNVRAMVAKKFTKRKNNSEKTSSNDEFVFGRITHTRQMPKKIETNCLVLDYLPEGKGFSSKIREPIVQGIGITWFNLVELAMIKKGKYQQFTELALPQKDKEIKTPVRQIKRKMAVDELTNTAYQALEEAVIRIIERNEKRFTSFFNKAQPITNRIHSLQLVPGIGKSTMWTIIEQRKSIPFVSLTDIEERTKISDIRRMISKRVLQEIEGEEKHRIFTTSLESTARR